MSSLLWSNGVQPSAADTLRAYLSLAAPIPAPKKQQHICFKSPLYVSEANKVGSIGASSIHYSLVKDPENPQKDYILCGQCNSQRLFSSLSSLDQHRKKKCGSKRTCEGQDDLASLLKDAEIFLNTLSMDDVKNHVQSVDPLASIEYKTKQQLIDMYLTLIKQDDQQVSADIPPIPSEYTEKMLSERAKCILEIFPAIPQHLLAVALLADTLPIQPRMTSVATQTAKQTRYDARVSSSDSEDDASVESLLSPPQAGVRRSARLTSLYRTVN